jgi:response regulator RpfG family c-di-GMP phosphodiesterase
LRRSEKWGHENAEYSISPPETARNLIFSLKFETKRVVYHLPSLGLNVSTQAQLAPRDPIAIPKEPPARGLRENRAGPLVLVVNTEAVTLEALQLTLEFEGFTVHQAPAPAPALALLEREDFAVVLADHELLMRDQSDLLSRAAIRQPYASIVALSSVFAVNQAMAQVSAGRIFGFVTKPWLREELIATIAAGAATAHTRKENAGLQQELRDLNHHAAQLQLRIEDLDAELSAKLRTLQTQGQLRQRGLEDAQHFCHHLLASRHPALAARSQHLLAIVHKITRLDGFNPESARRLVLAAAVCDLGMIGFEPALLERVLGNSSALTDADTETYETHPILSHNLACHFDSDPIVAEIVRNHHEHFDGSGFPAGIKGDAIPWLARCLAVAVYLVEKPVPHPAALEHLLAQAGRALDPAAVNLFFRIPNLVGDAALFRAPQPGRPGIGQSPVAPVFSLEGGAFNLDTSLTTQDLVKKLAPPIDRSAQLGQRLQTLG